MRIEWLKNAASNLEEAYEFMAKENPVAASEFINEVFRLSRWLITSCRSANNIMPITFFLPAFIASSFYSA